MATVIKEMVAATIARVLFDIAVTLRAVLFNTNFLNSLALSVHVKFQVCRIVLLILQ
jgi:hypothetical protein